MREAEEFPNQRLNCWGAAKKAGVSQSMVSRALRLYLRVLHTMCIRVFAANPPLEYIVKSNPAILLANVEAQSIGQPAKAQPILAKLEIVESTVGTVKGL